MLSLLFSLWRLTSSALWLLLLLSLLVLALAGLGAGRAYVQNHLGGGDGESRSAPSRVGSEAGAADPAYALPHKHAGSHRVSSFDAHPRSVHSGAVIEGAPSSRGRGHRRANVGSGSVASVSDAWESAGVGSRKRGLGMGALGMSGWSVHSHPPPVPGGGASTHSVAEKVVDGGDDSAASEARHPAASVPPPTLVIPEDGRDAKGEGAHSGPSPQNPGSPPRHGGHPRPPPVTTAPPRGSPRRSRRGWALLVSLLFILLWRSFCTGTSPQPLCRPSTWTALGVSVSRRTVQAVQLAVQHGRDALHRAMEQAPVEETDVYLEDAVEELPVLSSAEVSVSPPPLSTVKQAGNVAGVSAGVGVAVEPPAEKQVERGVAAGSASPRKRPATSAPTRPPATVSSLARTWGTVLRSKLTAARASLGRLSMPAALPPSVHALQHTLHSSVHSLQQQLGRVGAAQPELVLLVVCTALLAGHAVWTQCSKRLRAKVPEAPPVKHLPHSASSKKLAPSTPLPTVTPSSAPEPPTPTDGDSHSQRMRSDLVKHMNAVVAATVATDDAILASVNPTAMPWLAAGGGDEGARSGTPASRHTAASHPPPSARVLATPATTAGQFSGLDLATPVFPGTTAPVGLDGTPLMSGGGLGSPSLRTLARRSAHDRLLADMGSMSRNVSPLLVARLEREAAKVLLGVVSPTGAVSGRN